MNGERIIEQTLLCATARQSRPETSLKLVLLRGYK
jgi:hypothetical protein